MSAALQPDVSKKGVQRRESGATICFKVEPILGSADSADPMAQITLNEGLAWLKTLKKRHDELIALRNDICAS